MGIIVEWADSTAILEINAATKFIADQKEDMISLEKRRRNQLFQDPKQRGTWIEDTYGIPQSRCPNYAIDEKSGKRIYNPEEVKDIYMREGAAFLRNKIPCPPKSTKENKPDDPPPLNLPRKAPKKKPTSLPKCGIRCITETQKGSRLFWADLMNPVSWQEVLETIRQAGTEKAPGLDGVNADLVRLLTEDSKEKPTPLLSILTIITRSKQEKRCQRGGKQ